MNKPTVVAFAGKRGSGKSVAADVLIHVYDFTDLKFAGPLKEMIRTALRMKGLSSEDVERRVEGDLKEQSCAVIANWHLPAEPHILEAMLETFYKDVTGDEKLARRKVAGDLQGQPCEWLGGWHTPSHALTMLASAWDPGDTPRQAMQQLGTEWRNTINTSLWSDIFIKRVQGGFAGPRVVCSDYRFPHEGDALHEVGAVIYKIVRDSAEVNDDAAQHASEALTNEIPFDVEIKNNDTLEEFQRQVADFVSDGLKIREGKAE
jgi:antitoxin component of RelBE/YafQ-DinJ toxin-antitoxin module